MVPLRGLAMTLAFALEVCMLAAFFVFGVSVTPAGAGQFVAGLGLPAIAVMIWGVWLAPRSEKRLPLPWLLLAEVGLFGLAAAALAVAGKAELGIAFAVATVVRSALGLISGVDLAKEAP